MAVNNDITPAQLEESEAQALEKETLVKEQVECPVTHRFGPGIYIREVFMPAGSFVIGHYHKTEHLNIMLKGRLTLVGKDGKWEDVTAPVTFTAKEGRKIAFIREDVVWQNVFATEETDLEKLEEKYLTKSITFTEHSKAQELLLTFNKNSDVQDYYKFLEEFNFSHEDVRKISLNENDQIAFPYGAYSVTVSDSKIDGKGLFATKTFEEGDFICPALINNFRTPAGRFTNHSAVPNAFFVNHGEGNVSLVATSLINGNLGGMLGDEITVDYRQAVRSKTKEI